MELVHSTFEERLSDIESYFELVNNIEIAVGSGGAVLDINGSPYRITPDQQKIMYSGVYLHLYNLVEVTMSLLIDAVERYATSSINGNLALLTDKMRDLYIKALVEPHTMLSNETKLERSLALFEQVLQIKPATLKIPLGGGGNWDYTEIRKISLSLGVNIKLPRKINTLVQAHIRNDKPPLRIIKEVRNNLAHGSISFKDCGENHVASYLRVLIDIVKEYLSHVIDAYDEFITSNGFSREA